MLRRDAVLQGRLFGPNLLPGLEPRAAAEHHDVSVVQAGTHLNTPSRAISQIYVDSTNNHHAWIGYNGYNVNTPSQPGHVFDVTWSGVGAAVWTNISFNLPDFPITALVRDDVTGDLYAASDFGVMKLPFGTTVWVVAGSGLPMVEVAGLTIDSTARIMYAATHGRSGWSMNLSK